MSYLQHFRFAITLAGLLLLTVIVLAVHAILPFVFETTGSKLLNRVNCIIKEQHDYV